MVALLMDLLLLSLVSSLVFWLLPHELAYAQMNWRWAGYFAAAYFVYSVFCHSQFGKTLGKHWLGLKVINLRGYTPGFLQSVWRSILWFIEPIVTAGLFILFVLIRRDRKSLHDILSKTLVTRAWGFTAGPINLLALAIVCISIAYLAVSFYTYRITQVIHGMQIYPRLEAKRLHGPAMEMPEYFGKSLMPVRTIEAYGYNIELPTAKRLTYRERKKIRRSKFSSEIHADMIQLRVRRRGKRGQRMALYLGRQEASDTFFRKSYMRGLMDFKVDLFIEPFLSSGSFHPFHPLRNLQEFIKQHNKVKYAEAHSMRATYKLDLASRACVVLSFKKKGRISKHRFNAAYELRCMNSVEEAFFLRLEYNTRKRDRMLARDLFYTMASRLKPAKQADSVASLRL